MGMPVTIKGQVTIPKPIRERLGIQPGVSAVAFDVRTDGQVVLRRADGQTQAADRFTRLKGKPPSGWNGLTTEAIMRMTRGRIGVTLVDTNVLIDLFEADTLWADWSAEALSTAAAAGPLVINDVVFAELSVGFERCAACEAFLAELQIDLVPTPLAALFLAGKAFEGYRRRGGGRSSILPDFFIGAHAAHAGLSIITRDPRRYRSSFPGLRLIAPPPPTR